MHAEAESILCEDVRVLLNRDTKENSEYLSLSNPQIQYDDTSVEISYTPPASSSVISVNVSESNSRTLLRFGEYESQDEDLRSLETYIEPFKGEQNHRSQQSYKGSKKSSDTRVESKSALVIEHFKGTSYGKTKIRHRGRNLDLFLDPSYRAETARSVGTCTPIRSSKKSSRASIEPENRKRVVYMTKCQSI